MYSKVDLDKIGAVLEWGIDCTNEEALEVYDEIVGLGN